MTKVKVTIAFEIDADIEEGGTTDSKMDSLHIVTDKVGKEIESLTDAYGNVAVSAEFDGTTYSGTY